MREEACHFCKCLHTVCRQRTDERADEITFCIHYFPLQWFTGNPGWLLGAPAMEWSNVPIWKMLIDFDLQSKTSHLNVRLTCLSSIWFVVNHPARFYFTKASSLVGLRYVDSDLTLYRLNPVGGFLFHVPWPSWWMCWKRTEKKKKAWSTLSDPVIPLAKTEDLSERQKGCFDLVLAGMFSANSHHNLILFVKYAWLLHKCKLVKYIMIPQL